MSQRKPNLTVVAGDRAQRERRLLELLCHGSMEEFMEAARALGRRAKLETVPCKGGTSAADRDDG